MENSPLCVNTKQPILPEEKEALQYHLEKKHWFHQPRSGRTDAQMGTTTQSYGNEPGVEQRLAFSGRKT
jgi:hypothetical protein